MKTTTINISLPKKMYEDVKKLQSEQNYTSISELIRDSLRKTLYLEITENGFTRQFEDQVLKSAKEPIEKGILLETEEDIENYFLYLKKPKRKK